MGDLYHKLKEYAKSDFYPYHMPGHKRRLLGETLGKGNFPDGVAELDITEIDGFDNLHDAQGILKQIQGKAASLYGADESFYLINGSTAGILSAISATVPEGGKLLMARGSHKAVYHAVYLRKLTPRYLYEETEEAFTCSLPITVTQVKQALRENPDVSAVLIVSPTYEGLMADVGAIAEEVHKKGIPLIVDSAHGAHLGFHPAWPENCARQGADLVIESLHKTLPAPTQTAVLHANGSLVDRNRLKRFLQIYQSSSPSYLLMSAMEEALDIVAEKKDELFGAFLDNWNRMLHELSRCKNIQVLQKPGSDIGKLVVMDGSGNMSGRELYKILLEKYHLQLEMSTEKYVLAMFTIADSKEAYERMTSALLEIDGLCEKEEIQQKKFAEYNEIRKQNLQKIYPRAVMNLAESWQKDAEEVLLSRAKGKISGEFVNLYPPGIPIIVPGEELTEEICVYLQNLMDNGLDVQGLQKKDGRIVVKTVKE